MLNQRLGRAVLLRTGTKEAESIPACRSKNKAEKPVAPAPELSVGTVYLLGP